MTNVTDGDIFERIEAHLALIAAIETVITDDDCPLTDDLLPAAIVMIGEGTQRSLSSEQWVGNTEVEIGVLFARQCGVSLEEQRTQMLVALDLRDVVPDYFNPLDRLTLNNHPMNGIDQPSVMTKSRLELRPWGDDMYWATTYRFTVPTGRY